ncbi:MULTISPECIES: hypothetical protein [unclassified Clostridioides]|uniref:hypothetical protein n=1 Tax=unclassified Clostridioides TaxID=2635829 RepID=UPI001D1080AD|nr:hypothetical protein [Clostridioides sp. ES-W-0018-02]MCC0705313.1 hypothetical protein [Clostridioides sp. ES-S-0049-02]MCC0713074.1 hypothetical protein [Clostridioides sp. ES-W-0017-02]
MKEKIELIYLEDLKKSEEIKLNKDDKYERKINTYMEMSEKSSYEIVNRRHEGDSKDEIWDYDDTDYDDGLQGREI